LRGILGEILKKVPEGVLEAVLGVFLKEVPGRILRGAFGGSLRGFLKKGLKRFQDFISRVY